MKHLIPLALVGCTDLEEARVLPSLGTHASALYAGEPAEAFVDWTFVDRTMPEPCDFIIPLTCYPGESYTFTIDTLTCDGCTVPAADDTEHAGFASLAFTPDRAGELAIDVVISRVGGDERYALRLVRDVTERATP